MSVSRRFLTPVLRPDGIEFGSEIEVSSPVEATDRLVVERYGTKIRVAVAATEIPRFAVSIASVELNAVQSRHVVAVLQRLIAELEAVGA